MALGDGARDRGALADEIPGDEAHAGIRFVIDAASRLPVRFRAGYVTDTEIDELVQRCTPQPPLTGEAGEVLPFPNPHNHDDQDGNHQHDSEGGVA
jgi:S-DNA-T family DNA segregation ATPase FtsK/SpoIIIE